MNSTHSSHRPADILFSKTRRAVLSLLCGHADRSFYLREIARMTGAGLGPVQRELKQLTAAGILLRAVQGRQVHYRANTGLPVFSHLKGLVTGDAETVGVSEPSAPSAPAAPGSSRGTRVAFPERQLAALCRRHHIRKMALFGSVLRDDFGPDSDVDVLVEFEPGRTPGFAFFGIQEELSEMLGSKVDLNTPDCLSRYFRDEVLKQAQVVYEKT